MTKFYKRKIICKPIDTEIDLKDLITKMVDKLASMSNTDRVWSVKSSEQFYANDIVYTLAFEMQERPTRLESNANYTQVVTLNFELEGSFPMIDLLTFSNGETSTDREDLISRIEKAVLENIII